MDLYSDTGLCTLAKSAGAKHTDLAEEEVTKKAKDYAYEVLRQGRRSQATARYFRLMVQAYMDGYHEAGA